MNDKPNRAAWDVIELVPAIPGAAEIMADLAASEEDEVAGRTEDGATLLTELAGAAAEIRAKRARRRA